MLSGTEILIVLILVTAASIRGAFGFADGLFAMPLLTFLMPTRLATPYMAISSLCMAVVIIAREWRSLDFRSAIQLIVFGMIGIPIGIWLLDVVDENVVKMALGFVVAGFAFWSLWKPDLLQLKSDRLAPVFGLAAGVLGGAYSTSGPPLVIFGTLRRWSPAGFRAAMQAYCLFSSSWMIALHAYAGNITSDTMKVLGVAVVPMILGTLLAGRVTKDVPKERFTKWVHGLLTVIGLSLVLASGKSLSKDTVRQPDTRSTSSAVDSE